MDGTELFRAYWWLIFPIFGMIWGFWETLARERRARSLMDLIKSYVDQGKYPPKELLDFASHGMDDEDKTSSRDSSSWSFIVFTALAAGFGYGAYLQRAEDHAFAFVIVAVVMTMLALGALLILVFGRLVDAHQAPVRAVLRRLTGNWADADDIAQEAFARAWELPHRLQPQANPKAFVVGIAYQLWRGHRRAYARRLARDGAYSQLSELQGGAAPSAETSLVLRRAMDALPPDRRAVLALCLGAEFTHAEAATALGLPLGTIKSHIARGRERLQQVLGQSPAEDPNDH